MKKVYFWILLGICVFGLGVLGYFLFKINNSKTLIQFEYVGYKANAQATQTAMQESLDELNDIKDIYYNGWNDSKNKVIDLQSLLFCEERYMFSPNYADNYAVSNALKAFVKEYSGEKISDATWYEIWNNSRAAMHSVMVYTDEQIFGYRFLVYFEEKGLGFSDGVFFIDNGCWLDRP